MTDASRKLTYQMQIRDGLSAPSTFWNASGEKRAANCNGCGTEGWKGSLVPDTIWGLRISRACDIHDWMYAEGVTLADKEYADDVFLRNLLAIIRRAARDSTAGCCLKIVRERRAFTYYQAVAESDSGMDAFRASDLL